MQNKRKLEDFFKERQNYVIPEENAYIEETVAPPRNFVEIDERRKAAEKAIHDESVARSDVYAGDTKVEKVAPGKTVVDSGAIEVGGLVETPKVESVKKPIPPQAEVELEAPVVQEVPVEKKPTQALREELQEAPAAEKGTDYSLENPWMRALVGATPLLVGLLSGNKLEGVQTSADYFTKTESDLWKRELDAEAKIRELASKRQNEKGGKRFTPTVVNKDGVSLRAVFDTHTGQYLDHLGRVINDEAIEAGYAVNPEEFDRRKEVSSVFKRADADYLGQGTKVNPIDGELGFVRDGRWNKIGGQDSGKFTVKQEKDIGDLVKSVRQSPVYKSTSAILNDNVVPDLITAATRSNDPNWIAGQAAVFKTARAIQGAGVLTDRDVEHMGGTQQVNMWLERIIGKLRDGEPITVQDSKDLMELHEITRTAAQRKLGGYFDEVVRTGAERHNISEEDLRTQMSPEFNSLLGDRAVIKAKSAPRATTFKGKKFHSPTRELNVPFEMNGQVYWATEYEWPQVKKENPGANRLEAHQ